MTSFLATLFGPRPSADGLNPFDDKYYDVGGYSPALSGVNLGGNASLRQATFYRCVSIRAHTFATLPLGFYKRTAGARVEVENDPIARAFERPNPWQSCFSFRRQIQVDLLLKGNAFIQIVKRGTEFWLVPLDADRVTGPTVTPTGTRIYEYRDAQSNTHKLVGDYDVWHLQSLSATGSRGLGLIDAAREALGITISAERHSALFFKRGVKATGVLEHPKTLKPATASEMSKSFGDAYGGEGGAGKVPVLWEGMTFKPLAMSNKDAQFLETYKEGSVGIATFCGVPPHMVGQTERSTSWGTGIEEQRSDFVTFTVLPDCKMFEEEVERVFLDGREDIYLRFNVNALLRGKTLERFQVYEIGVRSHILTPNDCRTLEDMDPLPGGDEFPAVPGAQTATEATPKDVPPPAAEAPEDVMRAGMLASSLAGQILVDEAKELAALALKHSKDAAKWRDAVGAFYGRHAATVAAAVNVSTEDAAEYCREQKRLAIEGGAAALGTWSKDHRSRLVAMALGPAAMFSREDRSVNVTVNVPPAQAAAAPAVNVAGPVVNVAPAASPAPVVNVQPAAVTVGAPVVNVAPAAPAAVHVAAAEKPAGVQEIRIVGKVDAAVSSVPAGTTTTTVVSRDAEGRPKKVIHETKGSK